MVDLQKKRKPNYGGLVVIGAGAATIGLLVGGYLAWGAIQQNNVKKMAAEAADAGMAIGREQAKARISVAEAGTHRGDWTETPVSPSGYSCFVLNRGDLGTGYAWNVCGVGDDLIRITIGPRSGAMATTGPEAQAMMARLLDAAAPEVAAPVKAEVGSLTLQQYSIGQRGEALVGGAKVTFSVDKQGEITRISAEPVG